MDNKINSIHEKYLFNSRNPEQYIERSLEVKIPSGRKSVVAKKWIEKTGYTVDDIMRARHRNSYWKKVKSAGYKERNKRRWSKYNFIEGFIKHIWLDSEIDYFIKNTKLMKDFELAKAMKLSIPSIQSYRRKYNMVSKLNIRVGTKKFISLIKRSENYLRKLTKSI